MFSLQNLCFAFERGPTLFDNLSAEFTEKRIGILGKRGSGKSTLLALMMGLYLPSSGTIIAFDEPRETEADFQNLRHRVGLVFQEPDDQLLRSTVFDDVALGPYNLGWSKTKVAQSVERALEQVEMTSFQYSPIEELTRQEKKRICLAGVLAMAPETILLDSPDQGLDAVHLEHLVTLLDSLSQSLIVVSDDSGFLSSFTDNPWRLEDGAIKKHHETKYSSDGRVIVWSRQSRSEGD